MSVCNNCGQNPEVGFDPGNCCTRALIRALRDEAAALREVEKAARARLEVWSYETAVALKDALAKLDAVRAE